jgi:hypothetical protein
MRLVYHAVLVGWTSKSSLNMQSEMSNNSNPEPLSA